MFFFLVVLVLVLVLNFTFFDYENEDDEDDYPQIIISSWLARPGFKRLNARLAAVRCGAEDVKQRLRI